MTVSTNKIIKERDESIDVLRAIAIIGILIAHSEPNLLFTQLRGFDVVLMVFLSAVCAKGFDKENFNYFDYFTKRCFRLIFPVWIFLTLYYVAVYLIFYLPSIDEIISTYALVSDRYVWIIRILVVLALVAPIISKYSARLSITTIIYVIIIILLITESIFTSTDNRFVQIILTTIPYGLVYLSGLNINKFKKKYLLTISLSLLVVFASISIYLYSIDGNWLTTSLYKYPPRLYYISYALGITILLWVFRSKILRIVSWFKIKDALTYTGRHTYWIYLWHIPIVDIMHDRYNSPLRFLIIFMGAVAIVSLQDIIVKKFVTNPKIQIIFKG